MQDYSNYLFISDDDEGTIKYLTTNKLDDFIEFCHYLDPKYINDFWDQAIKPTIILDLKTDGIYKFTGNDINYYIIQKREVNYEENN